MCILNLSREVSVVVFGFTLVLGGAASWGQVPSSNDTSDPSGNTGAGTSALVNVTPGSPNSYNGIYNTAFGFNALNGTTSGSLNTAVGLNALTANTIGGANTAEGAGALAANTTGGDNTAVGFEALLNNTSGVWNVAVGTDALAANNGNGSTAIGFNALQNNTTAHGNTAAGWKALQANTSGYYNTAIGTVALLTNTTGIFNTASGYGALYNNNGSNNTATGYYSLASNTSGTGNTGSGFESLYSTTTSNNNSGYGYQAMFHNQLGYNNTAAGFRALFNNTSGSDNIALGYLAGASVNGSNNIDIGNQGITGDAGTIRIGAPSTQSKAFIAGIHNSPVTGAAVYVTSSGQLGVLASSERYKTAIEPMGPNSEKLQRLRPVTFHLKSEPGGALQYGLIAEEVDKVYPELVIRDAQGVIQGVRYDELAPLLLNEVQRQQREMTAQAVKIDGQSMQIRQLSRQFAQLKEINEAMQAALWQLRDQDGRVAMR